MPKMIERKKMRSKIEMEQNTETALYRSQNKRMLSVIALNFASKCDKCPDRGPAEPAQGVSSRLNTRKISNLVYFSKPTFKDPSPYPKHV